MGVRTPIITRVLIALLAAAASVAHAGAPDPFIQRADALLGDASLAQARGALSAAEKRAIGEALSAPNRLLRDDSVAALLRNPAAWDGGASGRALLGTILRSLPAVAHVKGINETLFLTAKPDHTLLRGHGTEIIAGAALGRFVGESGARANVMRIGGDILCADGRMRESDGAAMIGADRVQRLVAVKSISTKNAVDGAVKKAGEQLFLRNLQPGGQRNPGVLVVGYDDPAVYEKLKRKDWRAVAARSGAKLLVLAVHHHTGQTEKLAAFEPDGQPARNSLLGRRPATGPRRAPRWLPAPRRFAPAR